MDDLIERVTVAILDDAPLDVRARAAIKAVFDALAEPSQEMLDAGEYDDNAPDGDWFGGYKLENSWQAMLSQARKEAGLPERNPQPDA